MRETVAAIVAAHRAGASPEATISSCYARIHAHDGPAVFISLRDEADALAEVGLIVSNPAAWVSVKTAPVPLDGVTVMVAVRVAAVGLSAALYWKVPLPVPEEPCVIVNHELLDTAFQAKD